MNDKHRYNLPWDNWEAFWKRTRKWWNKHRYLLIQRFIIVPGPWYLIIMFLIGFIVLIANLPSPLEEDRTKIARDSCKTQYERWQFDLEMPNRERAYEGMVQCREGGDAERQAYFFSYLKQTNMNANKVLKEAHLILSSLSINEQERNVFRKVLEIATKRMDCKFHGIPGEETTPCCLSLSDK